MNCCIFNKTQSPIESRIAKCLANVSNELAAMAPLAATAGNPIPGKTKSPQQYIFSNGEVPNGKFSFPAFHAAP